MILYKKIPAFNCHFVTRNHNCVALAEVGDQALASTRWICLQYMSNAKELAEGDELILQHHPRYPKEKKRKIITWQDSQKELDRQKQRVMLEEAKKISPTNDSSRCKWIGLSLSWT